MGEFAYWFINIVIRRDITSPGTGNIILWLRGQKGSNIEIVWFKWDPDFTGSQIHNIYMFQEDDTLEAFRLYNVTATKALVYWPWNTEAHVTDKSFPFFANKIIIASDQQMRFFINEATNSDTMRLHLLAKIKNGVTPTVDTSKTEDDFTLLTNYNKIISIL